PAGKLVLRAVWLISIGLPRYFLGQILRFPAPQNHPFSGGVGGEKGVVVATGGKPVFFHDGRRPLREIAGADVYPLVFETFSEFPYRKLFQDFECTPRKTRYRKIVGIQMGVGVQFRQTKPTSDGFECSGFENGGIRL